ncbi:MAG: ATP-dependent 6-phosphofructokinase [Vicinamibacteria bacterium]
MKPKPSRSKKPFRIALLTGGGDCPGLNAVIRAAARTAFDLGWEVFGIEDGFEGLLTKRAHQLHSRDVRGIIHLGGTILGTSNRLSPFRVAQTGKDGAVVKDADRSDEVVRNFKAMGFDALIAIGGDGTLSIALRLAKKGIPVVGVPKTIDNDIARTSVTFGFDTAVATATDAIDKLHPTAQAHRRVMVVELMGRNAGFIALNSGVAGGADVILIPEIPFDMERVCEKIREREKGHRGGYFSIVVVAEGARSKGGGQVHTRSLDKGEAPRLGGIGQWVGEEIARRTGKETRSVVLGHLQRGGPPTTFDRLLGTRFGAAAVRAVHDKDFGTMVALNPPTIVSVALSSSVGNGRTKRVPLDSDVMMSARGLGISFGD